MNKRKNALFVTEQIRQCEKIAVQALGMAETELMLQAGTAAFNTLKKLYPDVRVIAVFCGGGNNAGDGYVLARLAHQHGFSVIVYCYKAIEELPPIAHQAALQALAAGVLCQSYDEVIDSEVELLVDALLGIGLKGHVTGIIAQAIHLMNDSTLPILALDIPSGLNADTGEAFNACIKADVTVTFIAPKVGLFTMDGPDHCGQIVCHHLQLNHYMATLQPAAYQLNEKTVDGFISPRRKNSHKNNYGHVLIIGGGPGMPGAAYLAALAAYRVGAGTVTIATMGEHAGKVLPLLPEALIYDVDDPNALLPLFAKASVCVLGPGLGESAWAHALFKITIASQLPLIIDASALRLLAEHPQYDDNWILTPHPGEAAQLLDCSVADIQHDRCRSAERIQKQYGGCVVLKGAGSIVTTEEKEHYICSAGNPGMATAGMGDVLSGVIGGLLAQHMPIAKASTLGVWLHAQAADQAILAQGQVGLMASDLMPHMRHQLNKMLKSN